MHASFMSFLSRRDALVLLETTSIAYLIGGRPGAMPTLAETSRPLCTVRPKQTEGPLFVDERLPRSDIRPAEPCSWGSRQTGGKDRIIPDRG